MRNLMRTIQLWFLKFYSLWVLSIVLPLAAQATDIKSFVSEVIPSQKHREPTLVLLETEGRVLRVDSKENQLINRFEEAARRGEALHIRYSDAGTLDLIEAVETRLENGPSLEASPYLENFDSPNEDDNNNNNNNDDDYPYRDYLNPPQIFSFFKSMRLKSSSQCFHRAQIWTYDLWRLKGIATNKVFLFFTPLYIRKFNYKWWFHVSPYINTAYDDYDDLVLDATYARSPLPQQTWTNLFIRNHATCPELGRYLGASSFFPGAYCHLRKVSMYYYHPSRIANADRTGRAVTTWDSRGLRESQVARP